MPLLSFPDRLLTASLTGGSWQSTAPLTNLQDPLLTHVARAIDAAATSSIILADLGAVLDIRVISLAAHNISAGGTIRVRGFSDSGYTTMVTGADTGTVNAWPAGFTAQDVADNHKNWTFVFTSFKSARYWKIEITDTGNPAGYIELGRCWLGEGRYEPARSILAGYQLGYDLRDVIEESLGGVDWIDARQPRRREVMTFPDQTMDEAVTALLMVKNLTLAGEVLFVTDVTHAAKYMLMFAFIARIKSASPLTFPYFNRSDMPLEIIERI